MPHPTKASAQPLLWTITALWTLSIFLLIPLARAVQGLVETGLGREVFLYGTLAYLGLLAAAGLRYGIRQRDKFRLRHFFVLTITLVALSTWAYSLRGNPEQAVHFVQYGTLSLLLFLSLRRHIHDWGIFPLCASACALVGMLDEIVQWITPNRYFDYYDIIINAGGALLVQFGLAFGVPTPHVKEPLTARTARTTLLLCSVIAVLFLGCFFATPRAANWVADRLPFLSLLRNNPSTVSEFGYKHHDPAIGTFFSRFDKTSLQQIDAQQGESSGKRVSAGYDPKQYTQFLSDSLTVDPLAYEVRVRLFRRDAHWGHAKTQPEGSPTFKEHITIAYREHRILQSYYPTAYFHSGKRLTAEDADWMAKNEASDTQYVSPVGEQLMVALTQTQYIALALLLLIVLRIASWRLRPKAEVLVANTASEA